MTDANFESATTYKATIAAITTFLNTLKVEGAYPEVVTTQDLTSMVEHLNTLRANGDATVILKTDNALLAMRNYLKDELESRQAAIQVLYDAL